MSRRSLLAGMLDGNVAIEEIDPREIHGGLVGAEAMVVEGAAETRVAQFTAGRVCARKALGKLGADPSVPIPQGEGRAPIWPDGFVGSITHTDRWCGAVVARGSEMRALGIDIEPSTPLKPKLWERVCLPVERSRIERSADPGVMGKVLFSAKEAVYKCQYPLTGTYLGFHAVELELGDGEFKAVFQGDVGVFRAGDSIEGRYRIAGDLVATACVLGAG